MLARPIIRIDPDKCNGCGLCVPACSEGAIAVIDGKARLISEAHCDGLGACLGHCPEGAITIEERSAEPFDAPAAASRHEHLPSGKAHACPGSSVWIRGREERRGGAKGRGGEEDGEEGGAKGGGGEEDGEEGGAKGGEATRCSCSSLGHWPVQLSLVAPASRFLHKAHLLVAADCAPVAYADFHRDFLEGRAVVMGCPKLDDLDGHRRKLEQILRESEIESVTVLKMEVPCCRGISQAAMQAITSSGKDLPFTVVTVSIDGRILERVEARPARMSAIS